MELLRHLGRMQRLADRLIEPRHDRRRRAGRSLDAEPGIAAVLAVARLTGWPRLRAVRSVTMRVVTSDGPPGGWGITMRSGLLGQARAEAGAASVASAAAAKARRCMLFLPGPCR